MVDFLLEALAIISSSYETERDTTARCLFSGTPGRPRFNISPEYNEFLLQRRFTVAQISRLIGVSLHTIELRMAEFSLTVTATYTTMSDEQLDTTILELMTAFPNTGNKRMTGYLRSRGMRIQQYRIRESMRRVDPEGTLHRALEMNIVHRRVYMFLHL